MTFKGYINFRRTRYDARGDFVRRARNDPGLPEVMSWAELRAYMATQGVPADVVEAGRHVWSDYHEVRERNMQSA